LAESLRRRAARPTPRSHWVASRTTSRSSNGNAAQSPVTGFSTSR